MSEVTVVIGAGLIGQAIARQVSSGKHVAAEQRCMKSDGAESILCPNFCHLSLS